MSSATEFAWVGLAVQSPFAFASWVSNITLSGINKIAIDLCKRSLHAGGRLVVTVFVRKATLHKFTIDQTVSVCVSVCVCVPRKRFLGNS